MKLPLITLLLLLSFGATAQNFNPSALMPQPQNALFPMMDQRPKVLGLETMKPISKNYKEKMQAKLDREEKKLVKLAEKSWQIELDLRSQKTKLKTLEDNLNDPDRDKKIEKQKQLIARIEEELKVAKAEEEISAKKVTNLQLVVEDSKFVRTE